MTTTSDPAVPADVTVGSNRWYLSAAPITRALVHLCVPMAAAMIVGAVYNVINSGFVGALHDTALLAAITLGSPLLALVMAVGGVFGTGGGALVSRLLGAAEHDPDQADRIRHVSSFAVWGAALTGAVVACLGLVLLDPLVSLLGADGPAFAPTRSFVAVLLGFVPVLAVAMCLEQLLRAEGAARQVMIGLITSAVANVGLDALFILGLDWGVAGAAVATGLANLVVIVYFAGWLTRHDTHLRLAPRWLTLSPAVWKPVFGVGAGELFQAGFLIVTALVLNNLAAGYGDGPLAAMGVVVRIAQVPEFLVMGLTLGVLPLLAYSYGKGDRARLSAALRTSALTVGTITVVSAALLIVFRHQVLGVFSHDHAVLTIGGTILAAQVIAMIANGFAGLLTSLFQATGRALAATSMALTHGLLFVPVVLLGDHWFGLTGLIWSLTVTETAACLVGVLLWLAYRGAIDRGLDAGSPERAEAALEQPA